MNVCAITGSDGVLGKRIRKTLPFKFYNFKKNITNKKEVEKWVNAKNFDLVIHLAAIVPTNLVNKNFENAKKVNVKGTEYLLKALLKKKKKPKWFFLASTSHVYGLTSRFKKISEKSKAKPSTKYGHSKKMAEKKVIKNLKKSKINFCIGRIFSFTDKNQKDPFVIPSLNKKIKNGNKKLNMENLNHYRDFLSTADICKAIKILYKKKATGIFNIGSGKKFLLKNIAELIAKKYNKKINFKKNKKLSYLISDNKKITKLGWKPKKFVNNLKYFY